MSRPQERTTSWLSLAVDLGNPGIGVIPWNNLNALKHILLKCTNFSRTSLTSGDRTGDGRDDCTCSGAWGRNWKKMWGTSASRCVRGVSYRITLHSCHLRRSKRIFKELLHNLAPATFKTQSFFTSEQHFYLPPFHCKGGKFRGGCSPCLVAEEFLWEGVVAATGISGTGRFPAS